MMNEQNVPQLRFSKIESEKLKTENWENALASEIFVTVNERNHPELSVLSASQEFGMIFRDEGGMNISHDKANEVTYKKVSPGQFVIHLRSFQGGFAHSKVEGITSPAYTILDFKDKPRHNDLFWKYIFSSEEFIKRLELITYGIRDGRSINFSDFSTLNFQFPIREEQQKIGTMLSKIDSLIQAKTQKLENLKSVKKSLLQKCFPKDGEKIPQLRFDGFSGEWKEKKFGDVVNRITELSDNVQLPRVEYEDILSEGHLRDDFFNKSSEKRGIHFQSNHILFGKLRAYLKNNILATFEGIAVGDFWVLETKQLDSKFLFILIGSDSFQEVANISAGSKMPRSDWGLISDYNLLYPPTLAEQQKIGQFFSKYDSLISLEQKKIENLKTIKKSLLQKMFI